MHLKRFVTRLFTDGSRVILRIFATCVWQDYWNPD